MHNMKVSKGEGWHPVFTSSESVQILVNNTGGGRVRLTVAKDKPEGDSYRGREVGFGDLPAFFMVPSGWTVWGRTAKLSEWATVETEHFNTPSEIESIIATLRQEMQSQTTEDNTALMQMINAEITARGEALAAEITARNAAIQSAFNTEAAARTAADNLEGNTRASADTALAARATALENGRTRKYVQNIGNGILSSFDITHGLGTTDVVVQVYSNSSLALVTPASISVIDANKVRVTFLLALAANGNRVVIVG